MHRFRKCTVKSTMHFMPTVIFLFAIAGFSLQSSLHPPRFLHLHYINRVGLCLSTIPQLLAAFYQEVSNSKNPGARATPHGTRILFLMKCSRHMKECRPLRLIQRHPHIQQFFHLWSQFYHLGTITSEKLRHRYSKCTANGFQGCNCRNCVTPINVGDGRFIQSCFFGKFIFTPTTLIQQISQLS